MRGHFTVIFAIMYDIMCNRSATDNMTVELHNALKIDASNLYCKITLVWLDSSLSVGGELTPIFSIILFSADQWSYRRTD